MNLYCKFSHFQELFFLIKIYIFVQLFYHMTPPYTAADARGQIWAHTARALGVYSVSVKDLTKSFAQLRKRKPVKRFLIYEIYSTPQKDFVCVYKRQ